MLLSIAARGTEEEDAANRVHFDLLQQELVGLIWARHNHLLQEILEQLIHLVLLEVRLDRLHVVELLHFVHCVFFSVTTYLYILKHRGCMSKDMIICY